MAATVLREVTLGVRAIEPRQTAYEACGLKAIASGPLTSMTASRLFDTHVPPRTVVLSRGASPEDLRIRLISLTDLQWRAPRATGESGPIGIEFTTQDREKAVHLLTPLGSSVPEATPDHADTFEATTLVRTHEGDVIAITERPGTSETLPAVPTTVHLAVHNLGACVHFMRDLLELEPSRSEPQPSTWIARALGADPTARIDLAIAGTDRASTSFAQAAPSPKPMAQIPGVAPGICRLRFDTSDMDATLSRVPGAGGSLVRGPASIDDPVLGGGLVAMVRSPFGLLIEIWRTQ